MLAYRVIGYETVDVGITAIDKKELLNPIKPFKKYN